MSETLSETLNHAINALVNLQTDSETPKNVKVKLQTIISNLQTKTEKNTKVSKALADLEILSDNNNLESFTRMELYKIVGILEEN